MVLDLDPGNAAAKANLENVMTKIRVPCAPFLIVVYTDHGHTHLQRATTCHDYTHYGFGMCRHPWLPAQAGICPITRMYSDRTPQP